MGYIGASSLKHFRRPCLISTDRVAEIGAQESCMKRNEEILVFVLLVLMLILLLFLSWLSILNGGSLILRIGMSVSTGAPPPNYLFA